MGALQIEEAEKRGRRAKKKNSRQQAINATTGTVQYSTKSRQKGHVRRGDVIRDLSDLISPIAKGGGEAERA